MTPKEERAYELRLAGKTFKVIAKELGYSDPSGAYQAFQRAREIVSLENLSEWRLLELYRLDALQNSLWDKALEGNISAVNAVLKVFDLRARLIGLYAPEKHEINTEPIWGEVDEAVQELTEIIDLGVKYAEELGIENKYVNRKNPEADQ